MLELRTATVLQRLLDEIECGEQIVPVSGFRSEDEQAQIYQTSMLENGMGFTTKYVMPPNHSEHQSGLAIDLALNQPDIDFLRPHFPYTGICGAFRNRAVRFGFIERYPKGKESITGIAHEPWHFRYVGAPHSKIIYETGVTLEEYLLSLKDYPYGGKPLKYIFDDSNIEIFYLPAVEKEALFEIEDEFQYTVSGDNAGGFIITIWRGSK
jgi:D-alanyl-D-alanine dipeptidase/carboxypeptidase